MLSVESIEEAALCGVPISEERSAIDDLCCAGNTMMLRETKL